jgi:hypothetical protein
MSGHGNRHWKSPRIVKCCDCPAVFETYGPNDWRLSFPDPIAMRCPACQQARKRAHWRNYNRLKRGADPNTRGGCEPCPFLAQCRTLARTQAPLMCQAGDRKRLRSGEIIRLAEIPALYLVDPANLADLWLNVLEAH